MRPQAKGVRYIGRRRTRPALVMQNLCEGGTEIFLLLVFQKGKQSCVSFLVTKKAKALLSTV